MEMEMNPGNAFESGPALSKVLSAPVSEIAVDETSHQTITISIPEPPVCSVNRLKLHMASFTRSPDLITVDDVLKHHGRICKSDDEDDIIKKGLVELGCKCKLRRAEQDAQSFLQWFGIRMLLKDNCECEVCNSVLAFETQTVVADAVADHVNGGREILMKGLKSELGQRALPSIMSVEWAADHDELLQIVQVLKASNARALRGTAIDMEMRVCRETAIEMEMQELQDQDRHWPCLCVVGIFVVAWFLILAGVVLLIVRGARMIGSCSRV